jgi:hypothetical protein
MLRFPRIARTGGLTAVAGDSGRNEPIPQNTKPQTHYDSGAGQVQYAQLLEIAKSLAKQSPWIFFCAHLSAGIKESKDRIPSTPLPKAP